MHLQHDPETNSQSHAHIAKLTAARVALQSGVTTARDLGVNHYFDIGVRELNRSGSADLPDIVAAGYHVRPCPAKELFVDIPKLADLMGKPVSGAENLRRIVRAQIDRGVNVIKILATERAGLPDTDPRKRVFNDEEIAAIVDEARKSGVYVAAASVLSPYRWLDIGSDELNRTNCSPLISQKDKGRNRSGCGKMGIAKSYVSSNLEGDADGSS